MWVWIIVALVVGGAAVFAFWPRRRGVVDSQVIGGRNRIQGESEKIRSSQINKIPPPF